MDPIEAAKLGMEPGMDPDDFRRMWNLEVTDAKGYAKSDFTDPSKFVTSRYEEKEGQNEIL